MIITIAGEGGSGKSTIARMLAAKLNYKHWSAGDFYRQLAAERNLTIDQILRLAEMEDWIDREVDDRTRNIGKTHQDLVFDGWVAWHFIPHSFKVFLSVDEETAAKRIFAHQRPTEEHKKSVDEMFAMMQERIRRNVQRYKHYYEIDMLDMKNYNLVIDTTHRTPDEIVETILASATSGNAHAARPDKLRTR